jgi:peptidoglycan/LPS O-acetylase OafA/YrhL
LYYACFFWFGAAVFARDGMATRMGSHWKFLLPVGLLVLLPASFATLGDRLTSTLVQAATAWVVALGAIGIFHRYCSSLGPKTRWLSDASYWMYLAHLPLVIAVQLAIYDRPWPVWGKFLLVNAVVALALLASYRWFIRYTWVGTMLNGSRQRPVPQGS